MNNMELETDIEALDMEMGDVTIHYCPVIPNPEGEPTAELKTADIEGTIYKIVDEEARTELENKVDKEEGKGLSENDYTDEDKAIVDGVTTALDGKVDKDGDKVLSDNNYSDEDKAIVDGVTSALNDKADKSDTYTKTEVDSALDNKVDKVEGKDLSENDFTDTLKDKLDGIEEQANKTIVDNALDGTSANPVENRVVKSALDEKLNADETAVNSNGLVIATPVTDTAPYIYRQTPVKESFKALMKKIVGASVVWNQILPNGNFVNTNGWKANGTATLSVANNEATIVSTTSGTGIYSQRVYSVAGHKILYRCKYKSTGNVKICNVDFNVANTYTQLNIFKSINEYTSATFYSNTNSENTINVKDVCLFDLTAMFGTTIADYVYTLETSQSGSGIAWLQSYGFFTEDYYAYKQNKLESGCVSAHKTYDGETLLTNTELSPITLRGLFKLSTDKLTVDGDEYNADGSVTRKYGIVDLGSLEWTYKDSDPNTDFAYFQATSDLDKASNVNLLCARYITMPSGRTSLTADKTISTYNTSSQIKKLVIRDDSYTDAQTFTTAMSGVYLIYELATPTTEQTTPFTETEIVGSTEEFIDYEVAQSNRDVAIPVGTDTDYYQEMKLPSLPTTSGNHNLIYNIATGFGWS